MQKQQVDMPKNGNIDSARHSLADSVTTDQIIPSAHFQIKQSDLSSGVKQILDRPDAERTTSNVSSAINGVPFADKPELDEQTVNEHLDQLGAMLQDLATQEGSIRIKMREILDSPIPERLKCSKPMDILQHIPKHNVSERHTRRLLQAAINEKEIDLPANTLRESHLRMLDKLESPTEKTQAYEMARESAEGQPLTAKHFEKAVERVIAMKLFKAKAQNDEAYDSSTSVASNQAKSKKFTAVGLFDVITKNCNPDDVELIKGIAKCNAEVQNIVRTLVSQKVIDEEKRALLSMFESSGIGAQSSHPTEHASNSQHA